ncbi:MAG: hypothetical protein EBR82_78440 [Caulobacteraceae bacterium]|nr:hypothetical protein [Caulobacteraceae bacterium]
MGKSKAPPAPAPIDASKATGEYLFGKGFSNYQGITDPALQQKLLLAESQYRPQYAGLELADINTYLLGTKATGPQTYQVQELVSPARTERGPLGQKIEIPAQYRTVTKTTEGMPAQMGVLDLTAEATRRSSALDREAQALQRQQEIDILGKYGQQTVDALRAADPYSRAIAEAQQQYATDLYRKAGTLGFEDQRAAEQMARQQGLAAGRIGDNSTIAAQALNRQNAIAQRSQMAQQAGAQAFGYNRALAGDVANILIGRPSTAYAMGSQAFGQGAGLAQQPAGPQLFDPNAGINLALQNQANLGNYQSAIFGAKAGREGAIIGGGLSALGSLGGAGIIAACWVAREVYGDDNPKWMKFREWLTTRGPNWLFELYMKHGEEFAAYIKDKPAIKWFIRKLMDWCIKGL